MADDVVHISENSPEYVTYLLMGVVNAAEDHPQRKRKEILDLYAECLVTVRNPSSRKKLA